jgi:threonine/homoserine/homoserine lactone efflux protein
VNGAVGDILPLAITVAISPVPIIAVILMLLGPRAGGASTGFVFGWLAGIVVAAVVVVAIAGAVGLSGSGGGGTASGIIKLVLGAGVLLLAVRQWRSRPRDGAEPAPPSWMAAVDTMTAAKATGVGFLLSAVNPKNLGMILAAGVTVGAAGLSVGRIAIAIAVFTVLASCTVVLPVVVYRIARDKAVGWLSQVRIWLVAHNAAVMTTLLAVIGAELVGKGVAAL